NHIKVADFGLVKDLEGMVAKVTGGVTPLYAAPETFDGWVSRFSDQYRLAIVYQELLTGHRPYSGTNIRQLVVQHMSGSPDLSALPANDRPPVERALAKKPEDRFPTCREFVTALRLSGRATLEEAPAPAATVGGQNIAPQDGVAPGSATVLDDASARMAGSGDPRQALGSAEARQTPVPHQTPVPDGDDEQMH